MTNSTDTFAPQICLCVAANADSKRFHADLSLIKRESDEWKTFIKSHILGKNDILALLSLQEVNNRDKDEWLEWLIERSHTEPRATVLSSLFSAIQRLGGFTSRCDCLRLFHDPDACRRSAAMILLYAMEREDVIGILSDMVTHEPDETLRREAAYRLACLGHHDGVEELLRSMDDGHFPQRVRAASALCALGNAVGISFLLQILGAVSEISIQEKSILVLELQRLLSQYGIEYYQSGAQPEHAVELILDRASEWIRGERKGDAADAALFRQVH